MFNQKRINQLEEKLELLMKENDKLKWSIDNPPKFELKKSTKYGVLTEMNVVSKDIIKRNVYFGPMFCGYIYDRQYIFKKDAATTTILHSEIF